MGENIGDLADAVHATAGRAQAIEQGRRRWRGRVIVAVVAALEAGRIGADERPCDDAADAVFVHILARDLAQARSEEHTSELQSLMRISYAVFCLKKKKTKTKTSSNNSHYKQ